MAGRKPRLSVEQRVELGIAVVIGRASGSTWKQLCRVYNRSKPTLWRCVQAATEAEKADMKHISLE